MEYDKYEDGYFNFNGERFYHCGFVLDWFQKYLNREPKTILEFGSFDCGDALRYKNNFKNCDVYSIEADPDIYKNVKKYEKYDIKIFNYAITNYTGETDFYISRQKIDNSLAPCGSILKATDRAKTYVDHILFSNEPIKIPCITIEDFCKKLKKEEIDLVHIDVEGSGKEVLEGFGKIKPKLIYIEIENVEKNYEGASNLEDINNILFGRGYKLEIKTACDNLYVSGVL